MKTTELFAEQVLIGLLVVLMAGLVFFPELKFFYEKLGANSAEKLGFGAAIIGAAYLIGMVYDRVVDTLLQDVESHCRLQYALRDTGRPAAEPAQTAEKDQFNEGKYRILVLANSQATAYMEYLRSRIRLTRALAVALPGITLSLLLALEYERAGRLWTAIAVSLPVVYLIVLSLKLYERKLIFELPPKTYQLSKVDDYRKRTQALRESEGRAGRLFWLLLHDEVWLGLLALTVAAAVLILSNPTYARFGILVVGLVLTLIVGWSWWRISITFFAFLRNYAKNRALPETK